MRRNQFIILSVFLLLLVLTIYNLLRNRNSTLGKDTLNLALPDPGSVTEVIIRSPAGSSDTLREVHLVKKTEGWFVNDSLPVKPGLATSFLQAVSSISVRSPLPPASSGFLRKKMEKEGTQAVFLSEKKVIRYYLVFSDAGGSYLVQKGQKNPVVFTIPGFGENPAALFNTQLAFWEDIALYLLPRGELQEVRLRYNDKPFNSFTLKKQNNAGWVLTDVQNKTFEVPGKSLTLAYFLRALRRIPVSMPEGFFPETARNQLHNALPFAVLQTFSISDSLCVSFYRYHNSEKPDPFYCLAKQVSRDTILAVKYTDLDDLFCKPSDFQE